MTTILLFLPRHSSVTPDQWSSFSNENILKTECECNASATLRGVIDTVLDQTWQDTERQRATVNGAFEKRIQELCEAKESLEHHLEKVSSWTPSHTLVVALVPSSAGWWSLGEILETTVGLTGSTKSHHVSKTDACKSIWYHSYKPHCG